MRIRWTQRESFLRAAQELFVYSKKAGVNRARDIGVTHIVVPSFLSRLLFVWSVNYSQKECKSSAYNSGVFRKYGRRVL